MAGESDMHSGNLAFFLGESPPLQLIDGGAVDLFHMFGEIAEWTRDIKNIGHQPLPARGFGQAAAARTMAEFRGFAPSSETISIKSAQVIQGGGRGCGVRWIFRDQE